METAQGGADIEDEADADDEDNEDGEALAEDTEALERAPDRRWCVRVVRHHRAHPIDEQPHRIRARE